MGTRCRDGEDSNPGLEFTAAVLQGFTHRALDFSTGVPELL